MTQGQQLPVSESSEPAIPHDLYGDVNPFHPVFSEPERGENISSQHHPDLARGNSQQTHAGPADISPEIVDFMPSGLFWSTLPSGTLTPNGLIGFGVEADLDFSAIDLSFIDTYNTRVPFEFENPVRHVANQEVETMVDNSQSRETNDLESNTLAKSLQQSIWRFVPAHRDHGFAEHANLSLPDQSSIVDSPESFTDFSRRTTTEKLDSASRDKILAIVLSQVKV
jgi:hypothetical protein